MSYPDYDEDQDNDDYEEYDQTGSSEDNQSEEYDYDDPEDFISQDNEVQDHNYHDHEVSSHEDNEYTSRKSHDWDPYSSDDDVEYVSHHVVEKSSEIPKMKKDVNKVKNLVKPPSELAFDRAITVLFNQDINGSIATFLTNTFRRRDISDMINPDLYVPGSDFYSLMDNSSLNQSETDLLSIIFVCNRCFAKFYGSSINEDWSNVTVEHFDSIGEEYGYIPIDRNVIHNSSSDALQHIITKILKQELDGPIAMSLSQHTKGSTDIEPLLNITDDEIDDLHYYTRSSRNSATSEMNNRNKDYESKATTRVGLKEDHKKLLKLFTSFVRSLRDENEKLPDWSNIDSEMFTNYCSSYGDVPNFTS